ncbi:cullin-5-like [Artemia franciscana]|uniref:cullin-5-like n=1 Tax=Artemia franciscana TaxID=6661 RepID=UPI0032DB2EB0
MRRRRSELVSECARREPSAFLQHLSEGGHYSTFEMKVVNAFVPSPNLSQINEELKPPSPLSLPPELRRALSKAKDIYLRNIGNTGKELHHLHRLSVAIIHFTNETGEYYLEVTHFQMAVLYAWDETKDKISFETLLSITGLTDADLRNTLWSLVGLPKRKQQVLSYSPTCQSQKDFTYSSNFWINENFALYRNGKVQKFGKVNLIGRVALVTEEEKDEIDKAIMKQRATIVQDNFMEQNYDIEKRRRQNRAHSDRARTLRKGSSRFS